MNIIQIQDRLKGLPNEALVNYVEEPMGEVPIYLALGELQRRKEMRERFQASQTPPPSVSEQLVAENKPQQMGLGAMAPQGMMPPTEGIGTPGESPAMGPRQLAASGIAANPVSNVGQYAEGGIVGYKYGDIVKKGAGGIKWLWDKLRGKGKTTKDAKDVVKKGFIRKHPYWATGIGSTGAYAAYPYMFGGEGDDSGLKLTDEEKYQAWLLAQGEKPEEGKTQPKPTEDEKVLSTLNRIKGLLPTDTLRESLTTKLEKKEKDAINMALMNAGLNMAGGQSPYFLENLTAGAKAGLGSYTDTAADIFETETDLAKTQRAEEIALMGQALALEEAEKDREVKRFVAREQGPLVAQAASAAEKLSIDIHRKISQYQSALRTEREKNGNTERAKELEAIIKHEQAKLIAIDEGARKRRGIGTGTGQTIDSTQAGTTDDFLGIL